MFQVDNRFNIRIVHKGDRYGLNDCLTHERDEPMVEFYDAHQDPKKFGERGQFVSRYNARTIVSRPPTGLLLDAGIPEWSVSQEGMEAVVEYVAIQTGIEPSGPDEGDLFNRALWGRSEPF